MAYAQRACQSDVTNAAKRKVIACTLAFVIHCSNPNPVSPPKRLHYAMLSVTFHRRLAVVNDRRQNGTKDNVWHVDMDKMQWVTMWLCSYGSLSLSPFLYISLSFSLCVWCIGCCVSCHCVYHISAPLSGSHRFIYTNLR